jgi:multimeric flavodoxin WrbA
MKVLFVNGSPHEKGCTNRALEEIASILATAGIESDFFWLGNKPLYSCTACCSCSNTGRCCHSDRVNEFLDISEQYDGFFFGSPVYFASATGAMTTFMDRVFFAGAFSGGNLFRGKPAAAVVSCRRAGSTATLEQLNKYLVFSGMPVVPSQYWNMVHGNTPDEVEQDIEGLQIMRTLARNMAWLLNCIRIGKDNNCMYPETEKFIPTNFIH